MTAYPVTIHPPRMVQSHFSSGCMLAQSYCLASWPFTVAECVQMWIQHSTVFHPMVCFNKDIRSNKLGRWAGVRVGNPGFLGTRVTRLFSNPKTQVFRFSFGHISGVYIGNLNSCIFPVTLTVFLLHMKQRLTMGVSKPLNDRYFLKTLKLCINWL